MSIDAQPVPLLARSAREPAVVVPAPARRPRIRVELPLVAVVYLAYTASRLVVPSHPAAALARGLRLLDIERGLGLAPELAMNAAVSSHRLLAVAFDYHYATLHYVVTPAVLGWLLLRRAEHYRHARRVLVAMTLLGLVGFALLPTAPPRMLASVGFVDTMARFASAGWWGADASAPRGLGGLTNEYAALPSLHVGWALWCGYQLARHARTRRVRLLGVAYPVSTVVVVIATANHFLLDAVAGGAVFLAGLAVVRYGEQTWAARGRRSPRAVVPRPRPAPALVVRLPE